MTANGRPRITGMWIRLSGPVWEGWHGGRIHVHGLVRAPDGETHWPDPLYSEEWRWACAVEPKGRRALMLYADRLYARRTAPSAPEWARL